MTACVAQFNVRLIIDFESDIMGCLQASQREIMPEFSPACSPCNTGPMGAALIQQEPQQVKFNKGISTELYSASEDRL